jgi:signal transduction histidine kinase
MRQLTKSLLEIAKADSEGNIELKEVRLDEVLLKITSEIKKINGNYTLDLFFGEFPDDEKDLIVFGNVELLQSAIKNIVENGCKYSPDKKSRVELSYRDHRIYVRVSNNGNAIATEEIKKIFQPFYRGENAKSYKGFGLGLALAKGITQLHKGSIEIQSNQTEGTICTMEFPSLNTY